MRLVAFHKRLNKKKRKGVAEGTWEQEKQQ